MVLPKLYHKGKKGELREWFVWSVGSKIYTGYGVVNGAIQESCKEAEPKNVGKSNETTAEQQAALEAESLWKFKVERKYSETPEEALEELQLPMLAHSYKGSKKKKTQFPADAQRKLDGVRCLASRSEDGGIALTSRSGKPWSVPHIAEQLDEWLPEGMTLDGEIYLHGLSCQRITSLVRSACPVTSKSYKPESLKLEYHVYDVPVIDGNDSLKWKERKSGLYTKTPYAENAGVISDNVIGVEAYTVFDHDDVVLFHDIFVGEGYEGLMLRSHAGLYVWGYRSADLLKHKEFEDKEFVVIGATEGIGKMKGCAVFICENDLTNDTFECTINGTMEDRRRFFVNKDKYVGRKLTVRFLGRTDDKLLPKIATGRVFRDKKDL